MNPSLQRLEGGKLYHSISEVCRMAGLEPHVLRYWETEFPQMRPRKNRAGNRAYRAKEIQYIHFIRYLLHDEKYTIQGAKKRLAEVGPDEIAGQISLIRPFMLEAAPVPKRPVERENAGAVPAPEGERMRAELRGIEAELNDVLRLLGKKG